MNQISVFGLVLTSDWLEKKENNHYNNLLVIVPIFTQAGIQRNRQKFQNFASFLAVVWSTQQANDSDILSLAPHSSKDSPTSMAERSCYVLVTAICLCYADRRKDKEGENGEWWLLDSSAWQASFRRSSDTYR